MTRKDWNIEWERTIKLKQRLEESEPPFDQKEEWREWLRRMVQVTKKFEALNRENKKLILKETEESQLDKLQKCINLLFGVKP